jgi:hypothetical protein
MDPSGDVAVEFEDEEELRAVYASDLAAGGIRIPTDAEIPLFTEIRLTLGLAGGGEITTKGTVVNRIGEALAVAFEAAPGDVRAALTAPAAPRAAEADAGERDPGLWERVRALNRNEKLLLAPKASRAERGVLLQENDAQVLYYLLKNPRVTVDEVGRIARSHLLSATTADLIVKTSQWSSSVDIRVALVNNPRTPGPLAQAPADAPRGRDPEDREGNRRQPGPQAGRASHRRQSRVRDGIAIESASPRPYSLPHGRPNPGRNERSPQ